MDGCEKTTLQLNKILIMAVILQQGQPLWSLPDRYGTINQKAWTMDI